MKAKFALQFRFLFTCLGLCLLYACAQVVSPTGGEMDVQAPVLISSEPVNGAINWKQNKLELKFNEYINLKDVSTQFIVSPPLKSIPEPKIKNKTLSLTWDDTLKPNTTYTFSFGNSIVDYTEQNAVENYRHVFSTGDYIDSLVVSGKLEKAFDHSVEKGILVMLYDENKAQIDSFPYKSLPDYFAKTNAFGNYFIPNVKAGNYKIFALKEGNANYLFDSDDEQIAFADSMLHLNKSTEVNLSMFQEQKAKLFLKKPIKNYVGQLLLSYSKPIQNLTVESLLPTQKIKWQALEYSTWRDTVRYWYAGAEGDSLKLKLIADAVAIDTLLLKIPRKEDNKSKGDFVNGFGFKTNINGDGSFDLGKKIVLQFPSPVKNYVAGKILLTNQQDTVPLVFRFDDSLQRKASIAGQLKEDSNYVLLIPKGVFEDYEGVKNDTVKIKFKLLTASVYGTLKLGVKLPYEGAFVFQLLDDKENVLREQSLLKSETVFYEHLKPGVYKLKLIADNNTNKRWDSGKWLEKRQAEKTYYYKSDITVRANWDLEEQWEVEK